MLQWTCNGDWESGMIEKHHNFQTKENSKNNRKHRKKSQGSACYHAFMCKPSPCHLSLQVQGTSAELPHLSSFQFSWQAARGFPTSAVCCCFQCWSTLPSYQRVHGYISVGEPLQSPAPLHPHKSSCHTVAGPITAPLGTWVQKLWIFNITTPQYPPGDHHRTWTLGVFQTMRFLLLDAVFSGAK